MIVPEVLSKGGITKPNDAREGYTYKQMGTHSSWSPKSASAIGDVLNKLKPLALIRQMEHRRALQGMLRRAQLKHVSWCPLPCHGRQCHRTRQRCCTMHVGRNRLYSTIGCARRLWRVRL
jgi:hypothetical protein